MAAQYTERQATIAEIRSAISAVDTLIQWSRTAGPKFTDCIVCGTPSFEAVVVDAATDASQFFKDLLL